MQNKIFACINISFFCMQQCSTHDTSMLKLWNNYRIMGVFLSINSAINLDAVAKNRHSQWIGNKVLVNFGLTISWLIQLAASSCLIHLSSW